ncbi:DUF1735 domain-containing protein [uncultured Bacteroides sp.]|uniref:DUF1735 domain-containing protein n=1 Tax=uncultured Bacteroides sp. TaxID=162156 RepID=UPI00263A0E5A|nr:DUF1735 domain-containing protein [uncultured Bacteroides sp.]
MKKLLLILSVLVCCTSCYEDYIKDYDYSGIYFTHQVDVRSFIIGERNKFDFGAVLGGVMSNDKKREVYFEIDPSIIDETILDKMKTSKFDHIKNSTAKLESLELLPSEWYSLSNYEKMTIDKGRYAGIVSVEMQDGFLKNYTETISPKYVLPIRIIRADADSLMAGKEYTVIGVKYECKLFGYYYNYGEYVYYNAQGEETERKKIAFKIPMDDNYINTLVTSAPNSVMSSMAANNIDYKMNIKLKEDNTIDLLAPEGVGYSIQSVGECKYNNPKLLQDRKMFLNYKITNGDGSYIVANDTLVFRNRIRDGVKEWRDEDPENYK